MSRVFRFRGLACAAVSSAFVLAGCSSTGNDGVSSLSLSSITDTHDTRLKEIKPAASGRVFLAAPEPSTATWSHAVSGVGVIRDARAEAYLNDILKRLLAHWHGEKPERIGIFITADDSTRAKATPSGDILIPIGAFDDIENEDQLAALIGHEAGHIILKHHEDEKQAKQLADIATGAVAVALGISASRNSGMRRNGSQREYYIRNQGAFNRDTRRAMLYHQGFVTLTQDILLTAYGRHQEHEADIFGMRLAGHAGYEPRAILTLIQRWHDAEVAERERLSKRMAKVQSLGDGIMGAFGQVAASIVASHPSAEERKKNVGSDLRVVFAGTAPRPMAKQRYAAVLASAAFDRKRRLWRLLRQASREYFEGNLATAAELVRKASRMPGARHPSSRFIIYQSLKAVGEDQAAFDMLASADLNQSAPKDFYLALAHGHASRRDFKRAYEVARIGERYYGDAILPAALVVARIETTLRMTAGTGHQPLPADLVERRTTLMARCERTHDEALVEECRMALAGIDPEQDYRACGGVVRFLAGFAPGGGANPCAPSGDKAFAPDMPGQQQHPAAPAPQPTSTAPTLTSPASMFGSLMGSILR